MASKCFVKVEDQSLENLRVLLWGPNLKDEVFSRWTQGQDGDFYLQNFAGELASKLGININNPNVKQIQEGGIEANVCGDGQLYHFKDVTLSSTQQPAQPASTVVPLPPVLPECESSQSSAGSSQDTGATCVWSHAAVLLLIETYREQKHHFASPLRKKKDVWNTIARIVNEENYNYTGDQCDKKWRSLTHRYKTIKDSQKQTGNGRRRWDFYDQMDDILANSAVIQPLAIVSSDDGIEISERCNTTATAQPGVAKEVGIERGQPKASVPNDAATPGKEMATPAKKSAKALFTRKRKATGDPPKWLESMLAQQQKQNQAVEELIEIEKERNHLLKSLVDKL